MAYRASTGDLDRPDRWDRERFQYERDRSRHGEDHVRFEERDSDRVYRRPPSETRTSWGDDRRRRATTTTFEDDYVRDRRYYEDDRRYPQRAPSPPQRRESFERRVMVEKDHVRSPSPVRRPATLLRRQSSLDTYDRRPRIFHERVEHGPPARREDYRPPNYVDIPLPRRRALPPADRRRYETYEEIRVSDPDHYGDEEFRPYPERVREREVIRTRHRSISRSRSRSRESRRTRSTMRSSSRSSSVTSTTSSGRSKVTVKSVKSTKSVKSVKSVKSEYPKKGKTRIPAKLLSKRAIIELDYPFEEEGNMIIIQKALGQENIDDLLKLSEDYKKAEFEVVAARSEPGKIIEERREEVVFAKEPEYVEPPLIYNAIPPPAPIPPAEVNNTTTLVVRNASPARSCSTTTTSSSHSPVIIHASPRYREVSEDVAIGPLALADSAGHHHHHHHHHRRHSRHHSHHRSLSRGGEIVRAERLSDGQLVIYEERLERIEEPRRGIRIEKDRKGRMSISVPKRR